MSNSSPAHSSVSVATSGGGGAAAMAAAAEESSGFHFPTDLISAQDRKDEAVLVLKSELMASLNKEVKSLDEDNWMFTGPRSQIHLISRPGGLLHNHTETARRWHSGQLK